MRLHQIISELVPAQNFLMALYHPDTQEISIPYFVDEKDEQAPVKRFDYGWACRPTSCSASRRRCWTGPGWKR
jgi:hypothetical protein